MLICGALAGLVIALVGGTWLAATNMALGTFFFALAVMLGPFAGLALLLGAAAASTALSRSLFSVGGLFLVGAISTLWAHGTLTGAIAVWLHWAHGHFALRPLRRAHAARWER